MVKKFDNIYNKIITEAWYHSKNKKNKLVNTLIKQFVQAADFQFIGGDLSTFGKIQGKFFIKITMSGQQNKRLLTVQLFKKDKKTAIKGFSSKNIKISDSTSVDKLIQQVNDIIAPAGIDLTDTNNDEDEDEDDDENSNNTDLSTTSKKLLLTLKNAKDKKTAAIAAAKYIAVSYSSKPNAILKDQKFKKLLSVL